MPGVSFDFDSARRIAGAVQRSEEAANALPGQKLFESQPVRQPLVLTPTLPGGYSGTTKLEGWMVDRLYNGTIQKLSNVYILGANSQALTGATVYPARRSGLASASTTTKPLYLVDDAGSGLASNYIGETCQGYYNGDTVVTGSGGYVTCRVPAGPAASPWSITEYWRLRNGAELNTSFCPWQINQFMPTSGWAFPNIPSTANVLLRFVGKRGPLISTGPNVYDCLQYSLPSFSIGGQMVCDGFGGVKFKIFGGANQYFETWLYGPNQGFGGAGGLFSGQVQWSALYDGSSSGNAWAKMYRAIAQLSGTFPALIGFDMDIGWHIRASTTATLSTRNTSFVVG